MPLEYAGYLPTQQINWGSLSGKVADTITKIGEDRAARKAELDKAAEDVNSLVSNTDLSGSQTLNGAILDGAMTARNQIARWTKELKMGQMKPDEYKKRMSSLSSNWSTLTNSVKTFDEKFSDIMKRQQPDENGKVPASSFELALASEYGKLADLTNRSLQISDDGSLLWTKIDPKTGQVVSMDDVRAMNKPENIIDNRLDVPQQVESLTKGFDPWTIWQATGKGGEINIEDIRNNPDFKFMKANVMNTVANNPRAIVSILSDNGVVAPMFYKNDDERKQKREAEVKRLEQINKDAGITGGLTADQLKKIDLSLIKYEMGPDGVINPVPNEEQTNAAKNRVGQEIEIQMGRKVTGTPQAYYKPESGGGTSGGGGSKPQDTSAYENWIKLWEDAPESELTARLLPSYQKQGLQVRRTKNGTSIVKVTTNPRTRVKTEEEVVPATTKGESVQAYFLSPQESDKITTQRPLYYLKYGSSTNNNDPLNLGI